VLELDLVGRPVTLSERDVRWIYEQAKVASGSSLGARDLVTRLQALDPDRERSRLVLNRPEASALARLLDAADETPPGCEELRANLVELLGPSRSDLSTTRRR
jgi:hypothetical protein